MKQNQAELQVLTSNVGDGDFNALTVNYPNLEF